MAKKYAIDDNDMYDSSMTDPWKGIRQSTVYLAIVTEDFVKDAKCVLQKDYAIMLKKPVIVLIKKGMKLEKNFFKGANIIGKFVFKDSDDIKRHHEAIGKLIKEENEKGHEGNQPN